MVLVSVYRRPARRWDGAFNEKAGPTLTRGGPAWVLLEVTEPHQAAAISASQVAKRTRLDVCQPLMCFDSAAEGLLLLGGLLLFRLLRFLGHVALRCPTIGSMQFEHRLA